MCGLNAPSPALSLPSPGSTVGPSAGCSSPEAATLGLEQRWDAGTQHPDGEAGEVAEAALTPSLAGSIGG